MTVIYYRMFQKRRLWIRFFFPFITFKTNSLLFLLLCFSDLLFFFLVLFCFFLLFLISASVFYSVQSSFFYSVYFSSTCFGKVLFCLCGPLIFILQNKEHNMHLPAVKKKKSVFLGSEFFS